MELRIIKMIALVALWIGVTFGLRAQTVVEYIHTDALGTPIAVTNAAGTVIEHSVYEPYGQLINRPLTDGPGFTGHVQDAATGLAYMQQRYYDPDSGRFLSVDPVAANPNTGASFNRYIYASGNPYKFTDPDGRSDVNYNHKSDFFFDSTDRFDIPGMTTVTGHSWPTGFQDNREFKPGPPVDYAALKNDISRVRGPNGDEGYIYLGGCNLGLGNVPSKLAKDFNTTVISSTGYLKKSETSDGDITFYANSRTDGKGLPRWFQLTSPAGNTSGRIGSITMHANGKVTFKAAEAPAGSHIKPTVTVDPEKRL